VSKSIIGSQFGMYLIVGGISCVFDVGIFWVLIYVGVGIIAGSVLSFILSTIINYFLSYVLAFVRGRFTPMNEILRLLIVSIVGLILNTALVLFFIQLGITAVLAKVFSIICVFFWNFFGRRIFVFHKDLPPPSLNIAISQHSNRSKEKP
jgi:putative flippase GtrA